jgi:hypothetical protein
MTELETLKKKCLKKDGSPRADATGRDLARLKVLKDAEPLTNAELEEAAKREEAQKEADKETYRKRMAAKAHAAATGQTIPPPDPALDVPPPPPEHPRVSNLKQCLMPLANLEVHESRPDEFILVNRGVAITAGDVRRARKAMTI